MSLLFPLLSDQKERLQRGILIKAARPWENDVVEMGGVRIRAARTQGRALLEPAVSRESSAYKSGDQNCRPDCGLSGQEVRAVCVLSCFVRLSFSASAHSLRTSRREQAQLSMLQTVSLGSKRKPHFYYYLFTRVSERRFVRVCALPLAGRRGHWILWSCSYRHL